MVCRSCFSCNLCCSIHVNPRQIFPPKEKVMYKGLVKEFQSKSDKNGTMKNHSLLFSYCISYINVLWYLNYAFAYFFVRKVHGATFWTFFTLLQLVNECVVFVRHPVVFLHTVFTFAFIKCMISFTHDFLVVCNPITVKFN